MNAMLSHVEQPKSRTSGLALGRKITPRVGVPSGLAALLWIALVPIRAQSPNIPTNTWVVVHPTYVGMPNGGQIWPSGWGNKGAYDPKSQRVILSDRWYDTTRGVSIFANGIYAYDPSTNVFTILKLNNWYAQTNSSGGYTTTPLPADSTDPTPPDHHPLTELEVVPTQNAFYTVNGVNSISLPDPTILNKTWRLDFGTDTWAMVSSATSDPNYPPNNTGAPSGLIYSPVEDKLIYLVVNACGCSGTSTYLFDLATNTWTALPQDSTSNNVNVAGAGVAYDSKRDLLVAYGGAVNITVNPTPHLWAYSISTNKWTQLADAPVAAMAPAFAYDSTHDIFVALVGDNTYIYNPNSNSWTQSSAVLNRPAGASQNWQGITYDPAHDVFVFEGGLWSSPLMALFRYDPGAPDNTPPVVSITAPTDGATVSGTTVVSATASDNVAVSSIQFQLDGANLGSALKTAPYQLSWDTTTTANGMHTLTAVATDPSGNQGTNSISVYVSNILVAPVISSVAVSSVTSSTATITWTTDQPSTSQIMYGLQTTYGSTTSLSTALVTSHSVTLTALQGSTQYHFTVISQNAQGLSSNSSDSTFTTVSGPATLFELQGNASEVTGITNGSVVTPTVSPSGLMGTVVVNSGGSVNFAPTQAGNGVYFLNCCTNTNDAYYKFMGATVGSVFNVNQGQISFDLTSRYSFAQRQTSAASQRFTFDVRDNNVNNHLFYFRTQMSSGYLQFSYAVGGTAQFYYLAHGTEDTMFGSGVTLHVMITWNGSLCNLYLNGALVQSASYAAAQPNWSANSNFDFGAYEYATFGGYDVSDDIIDNFTVSGPASVQDTIPPNVVINSPSNGASITGAVPVSATATDNVGVAAVQFQLDGTNLGSALTNSPYQISWDSTTTTNGPHTLTAVATDAAGNTASNSVSVMVNNPLVPPNISNVSAAGVTASTAIITWTTDKVSNSQVMYGLTGGYGLSSPLSAALVTSHSVALNGLTPSTTYYYEVVSQDAQGNTVTSGPFTFSTIAGSVALFQLEGNSSEVSGVANGSGVTPSIAPSGLTGTVVVKSGGSVNFTPIENGNGVYFLNCCANTADAYYKFTGSGIGNIFNTSQGQVSFDLTSRYSFAQRQATAAGQRFAFDVRDDNVNNHLFYFRTQISSGYLQFTYAVGGVAQFYYVSHGTEDTIFGSNVTLHVAITWTAGVVKLYLNGALVQTNLFTPLTANWTSASNFDFGAYEYSTFGGYNVSDDIIDNFTVFSTP